jgi:hypothetical protein
VRPNILNQCKESKTRIKVRHNILNQCKESKTGFYNFDFHGSFHSRDIYLDLADYRGEYKVVDIEGKGRGVIAARDIEHGELILAEKREPSILIQKSFVVCKRWFKR